MQKLMKSFAFRTVLFMAAAGSPACAREEPTREVQEAPAEPVPEKQKQELSPIEKRVLEELQQQHPEISPLNMQPAEDYVESCKRLPSVMTCRLSTEFENIVAGECTGFAFISAMPAQDFSEGRASTDVFACADNARMTKF